MTTVIRRIAEWREIRDRLKREEVVGFVPTMGALHEGHAALMDEARRRCAKVVASIFVNPIQFNDKSDYERYPRVLEDDVALSEAHGVDYVFAPAEEEVYPQPQRTFVDVEGLSDHLCGRTRAGHFRGVATVVLKLLHIVQPDLAFFGEKDYQQLAIVRSLAGDLNMPVEIVGVPTVREVDGLAMSSRNRHLSASERAIAPRLYEALTVARSAIASGEPDAERIRALAVRTFEDTREITLEYFELVDPETVQPVEVVQRPVRAAVAAWIGKTRLIDNVLCDNRTT